MLKFVINTDLKNDLLALNGISTESLYILLSLATLSSELIQSLAKLLDALQDFI